MSGQFSEKAKSISYDALQLHPSERSTFVSETCGADEHLRAEVESLLGSTALHDGPTQTQPAIAFQPAERELKVGDILSNRFRITRFIASGGMGSVYEAEDLALHEHVALKTIRSDLARDQKTIERFKREIQLARKVTHPNVCRIFDFAEDQNSLAGNVVFLTMELLPGETLAKRIRRGGPMSTEEALLLVRQMTAALTAAHDAGIVHRDFKTGNVMLVSAGTAARAVVTDFGLAYAKRSQADALQSLTRTGAVTGTPLYMAPEQITGGPVTPATDIYALGVVLFEMVTGNWPFTGDNSLELAHKRLIEKPSSPRNYVPTLDAKWEKAILRCLEREPQDRFASADDVTSFLEGHKVAAPKRNIRRRITTAAIVAIVGLGAVAAHLLLPKPALSRRAIAVLGFQNVASHPDVAWVSTALAEGLRAQLAAPGKLRTVSGEEVADYNRDIGLRNFDSLSKPTLNRLHRLGADLVVVGSYTDLGKDTGGTIHLNVEVQDAARGETIYALSADGTEKALTELVSQTGTRLRDKLGIGGLSPAKEAQLAVAQPNAEAAPLYSEGLERLRSFDFLAAQQFLEKAILADPNNAFAHAALAQTWYELGFDAKAREEAKKAYDRSANLPLEDRLSIEGRYRAIYSDWTGAIESYGNLYKHVPDNLDYGLHLAEAQMFAGQGANSLATLAALSKLPPPLGDDPRINLQRAETDASIGNHKDAQTAAMSAIESATSRGMKGLELRALNWACNAFENLGEPNKAKTLCQQEAALSTALDDKVGTARAFNGLASIENNQGKMQEALSLYEKAFQIVSAIGDKRDMAGALNNIAMMLSTLGHLPESRQKYEQALAIEREMDNRTEEAKTLVNLAGVVWQEGDLIRADREFEAAIDLARQAGDQDDLARGLTNLGGVLFELGQVAKAAEKYDEALSLRKQMGAKGDVATTLDSLGELRLAKADLDGAASAYNEALKIQTETGNKSWAATSQLGLATVLFERGDFKQAESLSRNSLQEFQTESDSDDATLSRITLARCLIAQKRFADAEKEIDVVAHDKSKLSPGTQVDLTILQSRIVAESGDRVAQQNAISTLRRAVSLAEQSKELGRELEARLALVEIQWKTGDKASARAGVSKISQDASRSGFELIARKANSIVATT